MPTGTEFTEGVAGRYSAEKVKLKAEQALRLKVAMAKLVDNYDHSDILLESSDGRHLPAHLCILKNRAPGFYERYIEQQFDTSTSTSSTDQKIDSSSNRSTPTVRIQDVDYNSLKFFIRCIYTAEEVPSHPAACTDTIMTTSSMSSSGYEMTRDTNHVNNQMDDSSIQYNQQGPLERSDSTTITRSGGSAKLATSTDSHGSGATYVVDEGHHETRDNSVSRHSTPARRTTKLTSTDIENRPMTTSVYSSMSDSVVEPSMNRRLIAAEITLSDSIPSSGKNDEMMTSFVELATSTGRENGVLGVTYRSDDPLRSLLTTSVESSNSDEQNENVRRYTKMDYYAGKADTLPRCHRADIITAKFIRLDGASSSSDQSPPQQLPPAEKKIFPMFFEMDNSRQSRLSLCEGDNVPLAVAASNVVRRSGSGCTIDSPGRSQMGRKRWSVTSLRSIDSADLASPLSNHSSMVTGLDEENVDMGAEDGSMNGACSRLGKDLVHMLTEGKDTDLTILTSGGNIKAHRCVLATSCPYFKAMLNGDWLENRNGVIELKGYPENVIMCALRLIYGGVIDVPEDTSVWELISFADMIQLDDLKQVAYLHIRGKYCHFFHKPCSGCVNGVLECLPSLRSFGVEELLQPCRQWQAKYFSRIWKTKAFNSLPEEILDLCYQSVLDSMTPGNILDIMLGCEKLQLTLPKSKSADAAGALVSCLTDAAFEYLASHLDAVIDSSGFTSLGKGYALNLSLFQDILPVAVHSLSPDTACKCLVKLYELITLVTSQQQTGEVDWNDRFVSLLRRLYELCDTHLIHYASLVVQCDNWKLLTEDMQRRIKETGIYVDIRGPRAQPPRLSSFNRAYKRSSSSADRVRDRSISTHRFRPPPPLAECPSRSNLVESPLSSSKSPPTSKSVQSPSTSSRVKSGTLERKKTRHPTQVATARSTAPVDQIPLETDGLQKQSHVDLPSKESTAVPVEKEESSRSQMETDVSSVVLIPDKNALLDEKPEESDSQQQSVVKDVKESLKEKENRTDAMETDRGKEETVAASPKVSRHAQKRLPTSSLKQPQMVNIPKPVHAPKKGYRGVEDTGSSMEEKSSVVPVFSKDGSSTLPPSSEGIRGSPKIGMDTKQVDDGTLLKVTGGQDEQSKKREEPILERLPEQPSKELSHERLAPNEAPESAPKISPAPPPERPLEPAPKRPPAQIPEQRPGPLPELPPGPIPERRPGPIPERPPGPTPERPPGPTEEGPPEPTKQVPDEVVGSTDMGTTIVGDRPTESTSAMNSDSTKEAAESSTSAAPHPVSENDRECESSDQGPSTTMEKGQTSGKSVQAVSAASKKPAPKPTAKVAGIPQSSSSSHGAASSQQRRPALPSTSTRGRGPAQQAARTKPPTGSQSPLRKTRTSHHTGPKK